MKTPMKTGRVLAFDIGGTGLKAAVIDAHGRFITDRLRVLTPHPCPPKIMVKALVELAKPLAGQYDVITIGFPGYVRRGIVLTAPNLDTKAWADFPLEKTLAKALGKPAKLLNDADVQGLGAIKGRGLEVVVTLGTGFGTAWFHDGQLLPHLEFAHVPVHHKHDFDAYIGEAERKKLGHAKWQKRVKKALQIIKTVFNYDHLYIGGGNSARIRFRLPPHASLVSNNDGMIGAAFAWNPRKPSKAAKPPAPASPSRPKSKGRPKA